MNYQAYVCDAFAAHEWGAKLIYVNLIEVAAGVYYLGLATIGFRNIYIIFYKHKKLAHVIFPLMYFFGQLVCVLQMTQCIMFICLNT